MSGYTYDFTRKENWKKNLNRRAICAPISNEQIVARDLYYATLSRQQLSEAKLANYRGPCLPPNMQEELMTEIRQRQEKEERKLKSITKIRANWTKLGNYFSKRKLRIEEEKHQERLNNDSKTRRGTTYKHI